MEKRNIEEELIHLDYVRRGLERSLLDVEDTIKKLHEKKHKQESE